uniref:hypothetical protein n=1 Tax=Hylemonella sp. TaxID=2066020 RepID=UPI0035AEF029
MASRKRSHQDLRDPVLQKVRVVTWFMHLVERATPATLQANQMAECLPLLVSGYTPTSPPNYGWALNSWITQLTSSVASKDPQIQAILRKLSEAESLGFSGLDRTHYEKGETSPSDRTLNVFDKLLSGSKVVYTNGPEDMPLWPILDGDIAACDRFIDGAAAFTQLPPTIDTPLLQWLFDELIDAKHRILVDQIPNLFGVSAGGHPVVLSYIERHQGYPFSGRSPEEEIQAWSRYDRAILLTLAIWRKVFSSNELPYRREMEWLMVGLCLGPLGIRYNEGIQGYVLNQARMYGENMDQTLRAMGVEALSFAERWKRLLG